jgi:hypothetical protein
MEEKGGAQSDVDEKSRSLRGDLIKWAREEQGLTMRWVADHGGPCLGYQSEVENKKKAEVRWDKLTSWMRALNVTEAFVRGQIPRYNDDPDGCRGLAADTGKAVKESERDWASFSIGERARQVLCLISRESRKLPRVVLAHVLGLELRTLDALMSGELPFVPHQIKALSELTTLPEAFFTHGVREMVAAESPADYATVIEVARQRGISPSDLLHLIEHR